MMYNYDNLYLEAIRNEKYTTLGPYNYEYPNVVVTGTFPLNQLPYDYFSSLANLKSQIFYSGLPRISSTPLGVNSLYNRFPYINQNSLQTKQI